MTEKPEYKKFFIGTLIITSFCLPIFRSGGRTGLSFWGWLINHTIFGPPVEYVPEEDYARELEGVKITREIKPVLGSLDKVMAHYQVSEESAQELLSHQEV